MHQKYEIFAQKSIINDWWTLLWSLTSINISINATVMSAEIYSAGDAAATASPDEAMK